MLDESALGQRVVVRYRRRVADGAPGLSDVTGVLLSLDAETAVLQRRSGLVRVAVADIELSRVIAAATRDILALERIASLGWRAAEVGDLDGWLLRADHGGTRRANSALPLTGLTRALPLLLEELVAWYRVRGKSALIQVPLPARQLLDTELDRLGWTAEGDSIVLTRSVPLDPVDDLRVVMAQHPSSDWLAAHGPASEAAIALLGRHSAATFASVSIEAAPVAIARGAVDEAWLGISALSVAPEHRRSGLATALVAALCRWAHGEHGAQNSYLQVEAGNSGALELYRQLGFKPHHRYVYRRKSD